MRHHYVPEFYLRSFTDPGCPESYEPYLWVVDLDDGQIRKRSPDNTAALTDYYAVSEDENRHAVEEYLSAVESRTAPVVKKILGDLLELEGEDKAALAYFAAVQLVRVPGFRNRIEHFMGEIGQAVNALMIQSRERYAAGLREAFPEREFSTREVDELYAQARNVDSYRISGNPVAALGHGLRVVPAIAGLLNRMSWAIMIPANGGNFWTSDNPVYYINPDSSHPHLGHALGVKGVEVNVPVGPERCLLAAWADVGGRCPIKDLQCAQERGIAGAGRYLFCSTESDAQAALKAHRRMFPRRHSVSDGADGK